MRGLIAIRVAHLTSASSAPQARYHTAVVHELGHVIGLAHSDEGVMKAVLAPGERAAEIDDFFASNLGELLG